MWKKRASAVASVVGHHCSAAAHQTVAGRVTVVAQKSPSGSRMPGRGPNMRASAAYRRTVAGNLLKRLYLEHATADASRKRVPLTVFDATLTS